MIPRHHHRRALGLVASMLVSGCQDLPELTHQTEHLELAADFPLCQGQLDHYERVVTTLEDELGTTVDRKIPVYMWDMRTTDPGWCDDGQAGCFAKGKVFAETHVVEHELVHAVVDTFASPSRFWSEGVAEALQVDRTRFGYGDPSADVDKALGDDINYATAGHFSRWLIETRGIEQYRQLLLSPNHGREAFESTYGVAFDDAEDDYFTQAPDSYGAFLSCDDRPLVQLDSQTWMEAIDIACDEPSTYGSITGLYSRRVVTIANQAQYSISTSANFVSIARCPDSDYSQPPTLDDPGQYGDIPEYTAQWFGGYMRVLDGPGTVTTLNLAPGRYRLAIGFESFGPSTATLEVSAATTP